MGEEGDKVHKYSVSVHNCKLIYMYMYNVFHIIVVGRNSSWGRDPRVPNPQCYMNELMVKETYMYMYIHV